MTRKHFEALAEELRESKPKEKSYFIGQWKLDVIVITRGLQKFNAQFDPERFKYACGYYDSDSVEGSGKEGV